MAVPLRSGHRIKVKDELRLALTAKSVFKGIKRRRKIISDRNGLPFSLNSLFSY
jgi:hypothetical protein